MKGRQNRVNDLNLFSELLMRDGLFFTNNKKDEERKNKGWFYFSILCKRHLKDFEIIRLFHIRVTSD